MNAVHKISAESVHTYACGAAYLNTYNPDMLSILPIMELVNVVPDYKVGDQIIRFSMIFSKLILNNNHVLNPISGKIT